MSDEQSAKYIHKARQTYATLRSGTAPDDIGANLRRIKAYLSEARADYSALDPSGIRSHEEMHAEVKAIGDAMHISAARNAFESISTLVTSPQPLVQKIQKNLAAAGAGMAALDPAGEHSDQEMQQLLDEQVKAHYIRMAKKAFLRLTSKNVNGPPVLAGSVLRDTHNNLKHAEAGYEALELSPLEIYRADSQAVRVIRSDIGIPLEQRNPGVQAYEGFLQSLPRLDELGDIGKQLFQPAQNGYAPLDNPRIWERPLTWLEVLKPDADFLSRRTPGGMDFPQAAIHSIGAVEMLKYVQRHGLQLGAKELLSDEGKPLPLLEKLTEGPQVMKLLFSPENWFGKRDELLKVYHALPETKRPQNLQTLLLQVGGGVKQMALGR